MKFFRRLGRFMPSFFTALACLCFFLIFLLLVILDPVISHIYLVQAFLPNLSLFPFSLLLLGLCLWAYALYRKRPPSLTKSPMSHRRFLLLLCLGNLLLFPLQLVMVRSLWFIPSWDPGIPILTAQEIVQGLPISDQAYYQLCPNNAPIALVLTLPLWVGTRLGLAVPYVLLPSCGAAMINLASLLTVLCVQRISLSRPLTLFAYGLSTVFILFSPHMVVPYTDAYSILFPVLALYVYLTQLRAPLKWFLITLIISVGAAIKPTVWIFFIALLLVEGFRLLGRLPWTKALRKRLVAVVLALILGALPGIAFEKGSCLLLAGSAVPEGQNGGISHYLMMGMNAQTFGGHSPEDVAYSQSFPTLAERKQANYARAWERFTAKGFGEAVAFFAAKLHKAYSNGAFAFNGSYLVQEAPRRTDAVSVFLHKVFDNNGALTLHYQMAMQVIWLLVLLLCTCALFLGRKRYAVMPVLGLTLVGVTLYMVLLESWPRYLFLYAPFYAVLACLGLRELWLRIQAKMRRNKPKPI